MRAKTALERGDESDPYCDFWEGFLVEPYESARKKHWLLTRSTPSMPTATLLRRQPATHSPKEINDPS